jgi:hypothetical protein
MAVARPQRLPGELIDDIIRYLLPDRQAIGRCTLVCRAWLPWTRSHLFSVIYLPFAYTELILPFLHLLQSPYCTFPPFVHCLRLFWAEADFPIQHHATLLDVLYRSHPWLDSKYNTSNSFFRKVRASMAKNTHLGESNHIMNIVHLFPALEHLEVNLQVFKSRVARCNGLPPISLTLKSLAVGCHYFTSPLRVGLSSEWSHLMSWVHREKLYNISKVYFPVLPPFCRDGAEALLRVLGDSLKHVHIRPSYASEFYYFLKPKGD